MNGAVDLIDTTKASTARGFELLNTRPRSGDVVLRLKLLRQSRKIFGIAARGGSATTFTRSQAQPEVTGTRTYAPSPRGTLSTQPMGPKLVIPTIESL